MRSSFLSLFFIFLSGQMHSQLLFSEKLSSLKKVQLENEVTITIDEPGQLINNRAVKIIVYALPNGNTTAQTFGKAVQPKDDWHYDIQHIGAQTAFIRKTDTTANYIVAYLENSLKSWPAWRRKYVNSDEQIAEIIRQLVTKYGSENAKITLCGHSGGGSFIFGYINANLEIPKFIERLCLLDATYGYETDRHLSKINHWLKDKKNALQVIAYNDSVVVYNGRPLVSATGGTWYRSKLMANGLSEHLNLKKTEGQQHIDISDARKRINFCLLKNPSGEIFHTVLVERNGFISSIFGGTKFQNRGYTFWADRAYASYILK